MILELSWLDLKKIITRIFILTCRLHCAIQTFEREWAYVRLIGKGYQIDRAKKLLLINTIEATQMELRSANSGNGQNKSHSKQQTKRAQNVEARDLEQRPERRHKNKANNQ